MSPYEARPTPCVTNFVWGGVTAYCVGVLGRWIGTLLGWFPAPPNWFTRPFTALLLLGVVGALVGRNRGWGRLVALPTAAVAGIALAMDIWAPGPLGPASPDREIRSSAMSLATLGLLALAVAARPAVARRCALTAGTFAFVSLMGAVYGTSTVLTLSGNLAVAPASAVVLLLTTGLVLRVRGISPLMVRLDNARLPTPAIILGVLTVPVLAGGLVHRLEQGGIIDLRYAMAVMTTAMAASLLSLVRIGSLRLERDREHQDMLRRAVATATDGLRRRELELAALFDHAPVPTCQVDIEGRFLMVNDAACEFFGTPRRKLLELDWWSVVHPDDRDRDRRSVEVALEQGGDPAYVRQRYIGAEGDVRAGLVSVRSVPGDDGGIRHFICQIVDLTDLDAARVRLAASEEDRRRLEDRYRLLAECTSDVVLLHEGRTFSWVSPSITAVLGWTPEELIGRDPDEYVHPADIPGMYLEVARSASAGWTDVEMELRLRTADGGWRWMSVLVDPITDTEGRFTGTVARWRDIEAEVRMRDELARSEAEYRLIAENTADAIVRIDADGLCLWCSPATAQVFGVPSGELVGRPLHPWVHPEDRRVVEDVWARLRDAGSDEEFEIRWQHPAGTRPIHASARALRGGDDEVVGMIVVARDVSAAAESRERLRRSEERFRALFVDAPVGMFIADLRGRLLDANPAFVEMSGFSADELRGMPTEELQLHEDALADHRRMLADLLSGRTDTYRLLTPYVHRSGARRWGDCSVSIVRGGAEEGNDAFLIAQIQDVTDNLHTQERLAHQALHDPLTGLANRAHLDDRLEDALARARRSRTPVTVMFLDLDGFKAVNDKLGHDSGDELLRVIARRLADAVVPADHMVARLGGDEFIVVAEGLAGPAQATLLADRIRRAVAQPVPLDDHDVEVTTSIGIAVSERLDSGRHLLRNADVALYRAKALGRDRWECFDPEWATGTTEAVRLESSLRLAFTREELEVRFEPIINLADGTVRGWSTLLRGCHPDGPVIPDRFLHEAEATGRTVEVADWVLARTLDLLSRIPEGQVAHVSLSHRQVAAPFLIERLETELARTGVDPARLLVELTEHTLVDTTPATRRGLHRLGDLGVRLVIASFGTGYEALPNLSMLPVAAVKLDAAFTSLVGEHGDGERATGVIGGLVRGMGLDGLAEGVATRSQAERLPHLGWIAGQGPYFGRPVVMDEALAASREAVPT